jgi:rod shape-determining protein MreC
MDTLLNRYRNITVLLLVIFAQLVLLAYQVKNDRDVRLIRMWAVTAVTPVARVIEGIRGGVTHFTQNYFLLWDAQEENRRMQTDLGRLKLENQYLKNELATADRARALTAFQAHTPSRMIAARVIGTATGGTSKAVFVDRGSGDGVEKGMAVITPDGIVGKVQAAYPLSSLVLLVTDSAFAAGVVSQKNRVHGALKGSGYGACRVDYVQPEEKVEVGEWFYTSGDDRIFPKGMPAGKVVAVRPGGTFREILLEPSGMEKGLEEVLVVLETVHQAIPDAKAATGETPLYMAPPLPATPDAESQKPSAPGAGGAPVIRTDADRLRDHYKEIGDAQGHKFGERGIKPPDFNFNIEKPPVVAAPSGPPPPAGATSKPGGAGATADTVKKPSAPAPGGGPTPAPR